MKLPIIILLAASTVTFSAAHPAKGAEAKRTRRLGFRGDSKQPTKTNFDGGDSKGPGSRRPGSTFCTYSPDYQCYESGWPSCCDGPNGSDGCPPSQPPCDKVTPSPTPPSSKSPPGSSYCTYSPDYKCYESGWPSCCDGPNGSDGCPPSPPPCDNVTPSPTSFPTDRSPTDRCVPDDRPRPVRDGQRFRFNLVKSDAQCVDQDGQLYEYGQLDDVSSFGDCADACVNDTPSSLVNGGSFRGIDFDCRYSECRCLFDQGTLDSRNSGDFDRTERNQNGYGSIDGARSTKRSSDIYCGKLVGAEDMEEDEFFMTE